MTISFSLPTLKFGVEKLISTEQSSPLYVLFGFLCLSSLHFSEWYGYHFPELVKIVNDNHMYVQLANLIGRRTTLTDERFALNPTHL